MKKLLSLTATLLCALLLGHNTIAEDETVADDGWYPINSFNEVFEGTSIFSEHKTIAVRNSKGYDLVLQSGDPDQMTLLKQSTDFTIAGHPPKIELRIDNNNPYWIEVHASGGYSLRLSFGVPDILIDELRQGKELTIKLPVSGSEVMKTIRFNIGTGKEYLPNDH